MGSRIARHCHNIPHRPSRAILQRILCVSRFKNEIFFSFNLFAGRRAGADVKAQGAADGRTLSGPCAAWVKDIFSIVRRVNEDGITVLLIEQNANAALRVADTGYVLETGEITLTGTGRELLENEAVREAYWGKKRARTLA